ncbi:SMC family ATPase [Microbacterium sp. USHLN186]|uniref:SMC family ATPase n=1 Tax=Microbacterium sp. USHLN186 TaxID=3081286 RepID=UPI00301B6506
MQLHRLEVEGFGPFRTRQSVDFDAFTTDGIFLIGGRTGAGKSSILDAVCFGLYGGVPRYDGGEKRLRSDHCEPDEITEVVVEFSTVAGRFRVTRSPAYERPAKRGGGMTTQQPSALLEELVDGQWVGRAARVVDVATELAEILQLSQEQFLQVILLAQNRFADFLLADSKERQALLRRLFGTERFADYQARFDERRRQAEQALGGRRALVHARLDEAERLVADAELGDSAASAAASSATTDSESARSVPADPAPAADGRDAATLTTEDRIARIDRAVARAGYRVERCAAERGGAEHALAEADTALTVLSEQQRAQADRDRARTALGALDAQAEEIADAAARRDHGRAAEALRSQLTAAARAAQALATAELDERRTLDAARDVLAGSVDEFSSEEALRAFAAARTRESGAWQQAAQLEADAPARERERADAVAAMAAASARVDELTGEQEQLPDRIAALIGERDASRREGDRVDAAVHAVDATRQRLDGAREAERLEAEVAAAARAEVDAGEEHTRAQNALSTLRRRRLDGYAGELATALVDGEPCAVCGSVRHPSPAAHTDPVSADDIAAAEAIRDAAAAAERTVSRTLAAHTAAHAAATARADGRSRVQAEGELTQALAVQKAAEAAAARTIRLDAEVAQLQQTAAGLVEQRAAAIAALAEARTTLSLIEQRIADADQTILRARGDHESVASRLESAEQQITVAVRAADAIDERRERARAAAEADAEMRSAIAASPFADASEAEQAMLAAADIAALDQRVTAHAVAREKERALLLDLEMRMLPEERIDLAPATAAAQRARRDWEDAVDADSRARAVQKSLAATLEAAVDVHAASAEDAAQFEVLRGLADALAGRAGNTRKMNIETFVLAAELEEIVAAANQRLGAMSDGRYQLRHSDALAARGAASGLGIVVFDAFTGHTRPAKSLSGGETFLSSLALALGLAEVVTARAGGIRLDTLFIDEGFGSLDADTLETAMRTLDELRQGGRTVGVISHVEAMQEQIPAQLTVRTVADGHSVIDAPRAPQRAD